MKILISGAAGFLGSRVVAMALERGHAVRALVRAGGEQSSQGAGDCEVVEGDIRRPETLIPATEGIDAVVHCAGATPVGRSDLGRSRRINTEGTAHLLSAAAESGRPRWIQISSMSAHPGSTSAYGRSKFEADRLVEKSGLDWTILRPSVIYGPGERGVAARTVASLRRLPVVPIVGSGREPIRPVYVDDVARAALDCLGVAGSIGKTYMIGGADEVGFGDYMKQLGEAFGIRRPAIRIPIPIAFAVAWMLERATRNPPLTLDNVLGVKQAQPVDISAARADIGFNPLGLEEGLRRTVEG